MKIPIAKPYFDKEEKHAVIDVLQRGWVVQGPKVREFEHLFKEFQKTKFALAVNSATSALFLSLLALGIKSGDEVIVPAFSHPATANVVLHIGAKPIFIDIKLPDFNILVDKIEKSITDKTKAIIVVHLFGLPADMDPIMKIAKYFNLKVIEDAACAIGAEYKGIKVGNIGDSAAFSFHPRKIITTGEGGIFTTNYKNLAEKVEILRNHGESISDEIRHNLDKIIYPDYIYPGYNFRMTDIQASIGVEQMKKLPYIMKERFKVVNKYNILLSELEKDEYIQIQHVKKDIVHSYQSYVILLKEKVKYTRDFISNKLNEYGISTRKGTYNIALTKFYKEKFKYTKQDFPNAYIADTRSLALPLYVGLKDNEIDYILDKLTKVLKKGV